MHFALFILVTSHTIAFTCKMELLVLDLLCLQLVHTSEFGERNIRLENFQVPAAVG